MYSSHFHFNSAIFVGLATTVYISLSLFLALTLQPDWQGPQNGTKGSYYKSYLFAFHNRIYDNKVLRICASTCIFIHCVIQIEYLNNRPNVLRKRL